MLKLKASTSFAGAAAVLLVSLASPALAQSQELTGILALAGVTSEVIGVLSVEETGPLDWTLGLAMADAATGEPLREFEVELTQELHVIATDSSFSTFVHEHAEAVEADGRFLVDVSFPKPGLYHIYTDTVPRGLDQQVLRFDLEAGSTENVGAALLEPVSGDVLASSAGPYEVQLDISDLRAGQESEVRLEILKDEKPADDLSPYLDVPAHAVFIATGDLAYVHAHAIAAEELASHGDETHGHEGHASQQSEETTEQSAEAHSHGGHGAAETDNTVPGSLRLYVTPPAPGTYGLWIQFMGGAEVQTAPFLISVE